MYFGEAQDSSANVAVGRCVPGGMRVCSLAATLEYLVAANDYDES